MKKNGYMKKRMHTQKRIDKEANWAAAAAEACLLKKSLFLSLNERMSWLLFPLLKLQAALLSEPT